MVFYLNIYKMRLLWLQVYYAISFSHLTDDCNLWGFRPEENKVENLQRKCLRIASIGLLKVKYLISFDQLKLVFDFHMVAF